MLHAEQGPWEVQSLVYTPGGFNALATARAGRAAGIEAVFFFGTAAETAAFLEAAGAADWRPWIFFLGALAGQGSLAAPASLDGRVFAAFPTIAADVDPRGFASYQELRESYALRAEHLASQVTALAAFEVLVEGLERSGRELSREKLRAALEGLYRFETGLTPPLTYTPNRRLGALGAYVVTPDPEARRLPGRSQWIPLP